MTVAQLIESYRKSPYRNIFFASFLVLIVDALTPSLRVSGLFTDLMLVAVFVAALTETVRSRKNSVSALALGVPAVGARLLSAFLSDAMVLNSVVLFLNAIFIAFLIRNTLHDVTRRNRATGERVYGALCAYVFIGILFSLVYAHIEYRFPGSFAMSQAVGGDLAVGEAGSFHVFTYFSFVTLTTLGYGDITPVSESVRTVAWIEALTGQLFLAVMVATLVGIHVADSAGRGASGDATGGDDDQSLENHVDADA